MNKKQKLLLFIALILFGISAVVAPYDKVKSLNGYGDTPAQVEERGIEYAPIWSPPTHYTAYNMSYEFTLRWSSVLLTWAAIAAGTGVLVLIFQGKKA